MATAFDGQIQNRNFLSPVGFKFTLAKTPKAAFFCNSARIPEISLGTAVLPTYLNHHQLFSCIQKFYLCIVKNLN